MNNTFTLQRMNISTLSKRILEPLNAYELSLDNLNTRSQSIILEDEKILGFYNNLNHKMPVIISTKGIRIFRENYWDFVYYTDIAVVYCTGIERKEKGIMCLLKNGLEFWIPINGMENDQVYDTFEFMRFLDQVQTIIHKKKKVAKHKYTKMIYYFFLYKRKRRVSQNTSRPESYKKISRFENEMK